MNNRFERASTIGEDGMSRIEQGIGAVVMGAAIGTAIGLGLDLGIPYFFHTPHVVDDWLSYTPGSMAGAFGFVNLKRRVLDRL